MAKQKILAYFNPSQRLSATPMRSGWAPSSINRLNLAALDAFLDANPLITPAGISGEGESGESKSNELGSESHFDGWKGKESWAIIGEEGEEKG